MQSITRLSKKRRSIAVDMINEVADKKLKGDEPTSILKKILEEYKLEEKFLQSIKSAEELMPMVEPQPTLEVEKEVILNSTIPSITTTNVNLPSDSVEDVINQNSVNLEPQSIAQGTDTSISSDITGNDDIANRLRNFMSNVSLDVKSNNFLNTAYLFATDYATNVASILLSNAVINISKDVSSIFSGDSVQQDINNYTQLSVNGDITKYNGIESKFLGNDFPNTSVNGLNWNNTSYWFKEKFLKVDDFLLDSNVLPEEVAKTVLIDQYGRFILTPKIYDSLFEGSRIQVMAQVFEKFLGKKKNWQVRLGMDLAKEQVNKNIEQLSRIASSPVAKSFFSRLVNNEEYSYNLIGTDRSLTVKQVNDLIEQTQGYLSYAFIANLSGGRIRGMNVDNELNDLMKIGNYFEELKIALDIPQPSSVDRGVSSIVGTMLFGRKILNSMSGSISLISNIISSSTINAFSSLGSMIMSLITSSSPKILFSIGALFAYIAAVGVNPVSLLYTASASLGLVLEEIKNSEIAKSTSEGVQQLGGKTFDIAKLLLELEKSKLGVQQNLYKGVSNAALGSPLSLLSAATALLTTMGLNLVQNPSQSSYTTRLLNSGVTGIAGLILRQIPRLF